MDNATPGGGEGVALTNPPNEENGKMEKLIRKEEGVTAIEYGLIAALIAVVIIVGATAVGVNLNAMFNSIAGYLK